MDSDIRVHHRRLKIFLSVLLIFLLTTEIDSIAIDNAIDGVPEITCMEDRIMLNFNTKRIFKGRVFSKGRSKDSDCSMSFIDNEFKGGSIQIPLKTCGMKRIRSLQPVGMSMMLTVIISFHDVFLTKVDAAYRLNCQYRPTPRTVKQQFLVNGLQEQELGALGDMTDQCTYEIRRDSPEGPNVRFANIGDKVFHVWKCNAMDSANARILVHDCTAIEPGTNSPLFIVDTMGCVPDPVLLNAVSYRPNTALAFAEAHVYKYAESEIIAFQCKITVCHTNMDCEVTIPPMCGNQRRGGRTRGRRIQRGNGFISSSDGEGMGGGDEVADMAGIDTAINSAQSEEETAYLGNEISDEISTPTGGAGGGGAGKEHYHQNIPDDNDNNYEPVPVAATSAYPSESAAGQNGVVQPSSAFFGAGYSTPKSGLPPAEAAVTSVPTSATMDPSTSFSLTTDESYYNSEYGSDNDNGEREGQNGNSNYQQQLDSIATAALNRSRRVRQRHQQAARRFGRRLHQLHRRQRQTRKKAIKRHHVVQRHRRRVKRMEPMTLSQTVDVISEEMMIFDDNLERNGQASMINGIHIGLSEAEKREIRELEARIRHLNSKRRDEGSGSEHEWSGLAEDTTAHGTETSPNPFSNLTMDNNSHEQTMFQHRTNGNDWRDARERFFDSQESDKESLAAAEQAPNISRSSTFPDDSVSTEERTVRHHDSAEKLSSFMGQQPRQSSVDRTVQSVHQSAASASSREEESWPNSKMTKSGEKLSVVPSRAVPGVRLNENVIVANMNGSEIKGRQSNVCVERSMFVVMISTTLFGFVLCTIIAVIVFVRFVARIWSSGGPENESGDNRPMIFTNPNAMDPSYGGTVVDRGNKTWWVTGSNSAATTTTPTTPIQHAYWHSGYTNPSVTTTDCVTSCSLPGDTATCNAPLMVTDYTQSPQQHYTSATSINRNPYFSGTLG